MNFNFTFVVWIPYSGFTSLLVPSANVIRRDGTDEQTVVPACHRHYTAISSCTHIVRVRIIYNSSRLLLASKTLDNIYFGPYILHTCSQTVTISIIDAITHVKYKNVSQRQPGSLPS